MKTSIAISALAALLPAVFAQSTTPFSAIAARSASPIHLQSINAAGGKFWVAGRATDSYCPEAEIANCPAGTSTVFAGGDDTLSLDVEVPAGQLVYIAPDGSMSFTQAHSANIPAGSIETGWTHSEGPSFGFLSWANGLVACPVAGEGYQIFGQLEGVSLSSDCLGFDMLTSNTTGVGAWEYI
ncbi:hypothetical protein AOQ84DRAFT_348623 [Glonium stellatum]|uniref:IgE-binding protein n=1 Tax=Glonium stellatum TaxID=574774 RepID=A0A8E2EQF5_9PEZI|nr:hypothetical protein AOQ84DRAFT_348623 [Glonium stellatum]